MNCLLCDCEINQNCSVEHIIPESLGNNGLLTQEIILPPNTLCDNCNNKFSRLEKKFLELSAIQQNIALSRIKSKKGKIKPLKLYFDVNDLNTALSSPTKSSCEIDFELFPAFTIKELENNLIVSNFLHKIILEINYFQMSKSTNIFDKADYLISKAALNNDINLAIPYKFRTDNTENVYKLNISYSNNIKGLKEYYLCLGNLCFYWNNIDIAEKVIKNKKAVNTLFEKYKLLVCEFKKT